MQITLGYAGSYASGFPDDLAHERWLSRLEQFADWRDRLTAGEPVRGPAADAFRHRVHTATSRFAGRVVTTGRQARDLLGNPLLHIFLPVLELSVVVKGVVEDRCPAPESLAGFALDRLPAA